MDAVKITVCIIDNGSASQLKRTQTSLAAQTCQAFHTQILDASDFWPSHRNRRSWDADYLLFLYSGSVLEKNAIALCTNAIAKSAAPWYYFDERNFDAELNDNALGIFDKPDFDPIGIAGHAYWSEGILISKELLCKLTLRYEGPHFGMAMMELFIAAAAVCDGVHIRKNLLIRHDRRPITADDQSLLNQGLFAMLHAREPGLTAHTKPDALGLHLFPNPREERNVSILL